VAERGAPNRTSGAPTTALAEQSNHLPAERYSAELVDEIAEGFRHSRRVSWWALLVTWAALMALARPYGNDAVILGGGIAGISVAMLTKSLARNLVQLFHLRKLEAYGVDKETRKQLRSLADSGYDVTGEEILKVLRGERVGGALGNADAAVGTRVVD